MCALCSKASNDSFTDPSMTTGNKCDPTFEFHGFPLFYDAIIGVRASIMSSLIVASLVTKRRTLTPVR
jgi:hypothetical protein